jgi:hypothetical protein
MCCAYAVSVDVLSIVSMKLSVVSHLAALDDFSKLEALDSLRSASA